MKKQFFICCLIFSSISALAQKSDYVHPTGIQVFYSVSDFKDPSIFSGISTGFPGIGLAYTRGLQRKFDWSAKVNVTQADSVMKIERAFGSKQIMVEVDLSIRWRLMQPRKIIQPYFTVGMGASSIKTYLGHYVFAGGGLQINVSHRVVPVFNVERRLRLSNTLTNHYFYSAGLAVNFGKNKKTKTVKPPKVTPAPKSNPDRDLDGVEDAQDQCPDLAGLKSMNGCPDADADGITDKQDKCPGVAGIKKYDGCPIPDTDGDGINDELDACISQAGTKELNGCPPVKKEVRQAVDMAAKKILFKTASFELLPESYLALGAIVNILRHNPDLKLSIDGHTDNEGTPERNKLLSERRANSVLTFLVSRGVSSSRIIAKGFGQDSPIDSNETEAGRAKNRRVELRLNY